MNRDDLHELIEAYRDGTIDEAGAAKLASVIRAGGDDAHWVFDQLEFNGLLYQAHETRSAETFTRSFMERLKAEDGADSFAAAFVDARKKSQIVGKVSPPRSPWGKFALLAATVLVAAGIFLATRPATAPVVAPLAQPGNTSVIARIEKVSGSVSLAGAAAAPDANIVAGAVITTALDSVCTIIYPDSTRLVVRSNSELHFQVDPETQGKQITLVKGGFGANVTKQPADAQMVLKTQYAEATVLGTRLLLEAIDEGTRLQVDEGRVRFKRLNDGAQTHVETGMFALANDKTEALVATPLPVLPAGWRSSDIGNVGVPGEARFTRKEFRVSGSGHDIWGHADSFHFVYQPIDGDGEIVALVTFLGERDRVWTKFGVMMRESLNPDSAHGMMIVSGDPRGKARMQRREKTGGESSSKGLNGWDESTPSWVKLVRRGDQLSGYLSKDGSSWQLMDTGTVPMQRRVFVGLVALSHDNSRVASGMFEHVRITGSDGTVLYDSDRKQK